ncbi:GMC family oxidoreductase [Pedobacter sp. Leaf216]|uniref:GMC family oxidoreductase n=1 Tax=Pedobacter sp. Leaf216 TaxID=1735684 RepID=UPI0009E665A2|nr:GMC family oxidoreductase N-terminal domain-containing protein [Pedobacter sp. Leaf216]
MNKAQDLKQSAPTTPGNKKLQGKYDYIIIGGGSAGCALTRRLLDTTDATILLLESASDGVNISSITDARLWPQNIGSIVDYDLRYESSKNTGNNLLNLPRGKVLGGSGSINGMVWARGHQDDYNGWANMGNQGWDFQSVLPFFKKIEDWEDGESDFHGAGGPVRIERTNPSHIVSERLINAAQSFGMPFLKDTNGRSPEGVGQMVANISEGKRCSPFNGYLEPVLNNERLTVLTNAKVNKIEITGDRCTGVEFNWFKNRIIVKAGTEVVLSAGAIESPKLLMLSGIGPWQELKALGISPKLDLNGVGKNLHDHVLLQGLVFEAKVPLGAVNNNLSGAVAYWKSNLKLSRPDLMLLSGQVPFVSQAIAAKTTFPLNCFSIAPALIQVKSRGILKLKSSNADAPLHIDANLLGEKADFEALVNSVEIALELASQPEMAELIKKIHVKVKNKKEIAEFIKDAAGSYAHPVGTCSMGTDKDAVVNPKLQVHGIRGLRIVDASIMPVIPAANTNAPTLMIAEYAAKLIAAQAQ